MKSSEEAASTPAPPVFARVCGQALGWGVALLPLVCWPDLEHPFSTPKLWLLAALALVALLALATARPAAGFRLQGVEWAALAWLGALGLASSLGSAEPGALILLALGVPLFAAVRRAAFPEMTLLRALLIGSGIESSIAVLQFARLDPLQWLGWHVERFPVARMRVCGTLGNPDFVASFLVSILPLAVIWAARRATHRWLSWSLVVLQAAAIAATGSRAAVLAVPLAALVLALCRLRVRARLCARRWARLWMLGAACALAALLVLAPARPLGETLSGRLFIDRAVLRHALDVPLWGFGPGAFAPRFPPWQMEELVRAGSTGKAQSYAAPLDHAHNDYLELLVDCGALGLAAFLALSAAALWAGWRRARVSAAPAAALAGVAAMLAVALVDFPLHRPAEWGVYWLLLGLAGRSVSQFSGAAVEPQILQAASVTTDK